MTPLRAFLLILILFASSIKSQPSKIMDAAGIKLAIEKLNVLGSVLYVAAHPDDENTAALSYFSKGKKYRTGYLALTRGDGGQNLIGAEKGDLMGVIRTNELVEARKIDGAEQFFTRAIDFGYSKSPEETIQFWGKENILYDIVWVTRKFRPDVIVTRFPPGGWNTHGHHLASAMLAVEAFSLAADSTKFPDQLDRVDTWQAKRIVWDSWLPFGQNFNGNLKDYVTADIGSYNKLMGMSYTEIAAESRSKHKSQGFGAQARRGSRTAYFKHLAGKKAESNLFDGIETGWNRLPFGEPALNLIDKLNQGFNSNNPSDSISDLLKLRKHLIQFRNNFWAVQKLKETDAIIQSCLGLWIEAISDDYSVAQGDSVNINFSLVSRSNANLKLIKIAFDQLYIEDLDTTIKYNLDYQFERKIAVNHDTPLTQPHWLNRYKKGWNFESSEDLTLPDINLLTAIFQFELDGKIIDFKTPVLYRWVDRVKGEKYRRLEVMPIVSQNFENDLYLTSDEEDLEVKLKVKSYKDNVSGKISLLTDAGWDAEPKYVLIELENKYDEQEVSFKIIKTNGETQVFVKAVASVDNLYSSSVKELQYDHIPYQSVIMPAETKIVSVNTAKVIDKIGYIMGAGDDIPDVLETLGYSVNILQADKLEQIDLSFYDVIITGIRSYNTETELKYANRYLLDFVKHGGRLIVQYNVSFGLATNVIGPYSFRISHDRVTDEVSEVKILEPNHSLFNYPNRITMNDFSGWVQERGLYFADQWDDKYETLISWHDTDESPKLGGLLYTKYGEGEFIYTGISFFRQLPAGVPGAIRLFVNLISQGGLND